MFKRLFPARKPRYIPAKDVYKVLRHELAEPFQRRGFNTRHYGEANWVRKEGVAELSIGFALNSSGNATLGGVLSPLIEYSDVPSVDLEITNRYSAYLSEDSLERMQWIQNKINKRRPRPKEPLVEEGGYFTQDDYDALFGVIQYPYRKRKGLNIGMSYYSEHDLRDWIGFIAATIDQVMDAYQARCAGCHRG